MDDVLHSFIAGVRLAIFFGCSGAIFALGVALVCRWLKWAPINITVNANVYHPGAEPDGDVKGAPDHG